MSTSSGIPYLAGLVGLALSSVVTSAMALELPSWVIASGGGTSSGSTYELAGTLGQPMAGTSTGGAYTLSGGFWSVGQGAVTPIDPDLPGDGAPGSLPLRLAIGPIAPNPTSGFMSFRLALPSPMNVSRQWFDVSGRWVRTISNGVMPAGVHVLSFDGTDAVGRPMGSGMYFERLFLDGRLKSERSIVVLR